MNKKQLIILWIGGIVTALILLSMGFDRYLDADDFLQRLCTIAAICIVALLFFYTLRNKGEKSNIEKKLPVILMALLAGGYILGYGSLAVSELSDEISSARSNCSDAESSCSNAESSCSNAESECER